MGISKKQMIRTTFGVVVVLCGCLFSLPIGYEHSSGNMAPYIISYTRRYSLDPNREVITLSSSTWLFIHGLTQGLSVALGGWLIEKIGPRPTASIGAFVLTGSTFLTAGAIKLSFWAVVITYGLLAGVGIGLGYVPTFYSAMQWLPQHTGLAIGLVMMGVGGSSFILIPLQTLIINPHDQEPNYQPDAHLDFFYFTQPDILERVPYMFIILGILFGTIQLITIPFIVEYREVALPSKSFRSIVKYIWTVIKPRGVSCWAEKSKPDEEVNRKEVFELTDTTDGSQDCAAPERNAPSMDETESSKVINHLKTVNCTDSEATSDSRRRLSCERSSSSEENKEVDIKPLELIKRWRFYLIWLSEFAVFLSFTSMGSLYKVFGESAKYSDHTLAAVGAVGSVCNCTGRVFWGLLADRIPCKVVLVLIVGGISTFMYTFYLTPIAGQVFYGSWVAAVYFCGAGAMSVYPTCCSVWYGRKHVSTNYGLLYTSLASSTIVALILTTFGDNLWSWGGMFFLSATSCFMGVICIIIGGEK